MKLRYFLFCFFLCMQVNAQRYVNVIDETLVVNSVTALGGKTRNITELTLPEHTIGYIYRITITHKGTSDTSTPLLTLLNNSGNIAVSGASKITEYAVKNNDNNAIDAFIFNNIYDANDFVEKKDGMWSACKNMNNRTNCCFESSECINTRIFFGFRNNNISQGLNVRLEVTAIIDDSSANLYSYSILNSTSTELQYFVSIDNINWEENTLRNNYRMNYNNSFKELYFKIYTGSNFVQYKIFPSERYKLILNTGKSIWDLIRY